MPVLSAPLRRGLITAAVTAVALFAAACGGDDGATPAASGDGTGKLSTDTLKIGYFPNVTHAPALVGIKEGLFAKALGPGVKLEPKIFNAGPEASQALLTGAIDLTYIGPNPAINSFAQSGGEAVRVIAGAASGGVALVVKPEINSPADLKGKKIATPQLGNTQDVAARYWLKQQGLKTDPKGGGDVKIVPQKNSVTVQTFATGAIDGAWVPEPFASQLVLKGKGKVLVDERDLWPDKKFVITNILVRTEFLNQHADVVQKFLEGHVAALKAIKDDPTTAQQAFSDQLKSITGEAPNAEVTKAAFTSIDFIADPLATTLQTSAQHASEIGLLDLQQFESAGGVTKLYDLKPLNAALKAAGESEVTGP
jgi:NitT/TauT family transport system substrate-binding protein